MEIKPLESTLRARIAAGEVIERPQSVARELIDNAIDAGADEITLSIRGGGIDELTLTDNGKGISKEDLPLAVTQYATSKIAKLDDLYHLSSMGFRGEALHSVAAVSRLTIASSWNGQQPWTYVVDNTKEISLTPQGPDRGTVVKVEDLFSEIPARRSFLKRPASEAALCRNVMLSKAMPFENIHFTFIQDGVIRSDLPKRGSLFDRVLDIFCEDEAFNRKEFIYMEREFGDFRIRIVTSLAGIRRSDRSRIKVYVNNRAVEEFSLVQAVCYGYGETLPGGSFPYTALFIDDNPELVDFNIHPAKKEVKLRNKAAIHHEIHTLIRSSLPRQIPGIAARKSDEDSQPYLTVPAAETRTSFISPSYTADRIKYDGSRSYQEAGKNDEVCERPADSAWLEKARKLFRQQEEKQYEKTQLKADDFWHTESRAFRYIGQAFRLFLICEKDGCLYLVDQHAAHERILFNELKEQKDVQQLLIPVDFEVDSDVDAFLCESAYIYTQYGINIAQKDEKLWTLTSIPHSAKENEKRIVSYIQSAIGSEEEIEAGLYAIVACKAAIKAGDIVDDYTANALLEKVFELDDPVCPHGRTFVIRLSEAELREMVGRTK